MKRHGALFLLHMQDVLQYKLRSFVWMLVNCTGIGILIIFWMAKIHSNPSAYSVADLQVLISYYLLMLLCGNVLISHTETDVSVLDVQKGELSNYLLKPISYLQMKFYGEINWRILSGFWAVLLLIGVRIAGFPIHITQSVGMLLLFLISACLGFLVSFLLTMILGLSAIWVTSTKGLFELYEVVLLLFTGSMIPLSHFPEQFKSIVYLTPFASILPIPVEFLQGIPEGTTILWRLGLQFIWLTVFYLFYRVIWKAGVRAYSGVGQ
ncbi:ABC-2 family transporter protein [Candidatus Woesebacteria bacterium]|nr:ABC-2 family transporter protein [Candidatus Woesebacteria bacterium]